MKKTYTKPYVAVESFQLDASIASSCSSSGLATLGQAVDTCTLDDAIGTKAPDMNIFGLACAAADEIDVVRSTDGYNGYCYHGPMIDVNTLFMNS